MGFMDKFKDMQEQAQQAAQAAQGSVAGMGGMGGAAAEAEKAHEVKPGGGAPYTASFNQQLIEQSVESYKGKVGQEITVNVDPDDPNSMLLWG
jgi:hypothetical protein